MTTWTTEMRDILKAEVAKSIFSAADIATILNKQFNIDLTRNAVIGEKSRLGLCSKRGTPYAPRPKPPRPKRPRAERKATCVIAAKLVQFVKPEPVIIVDDSGNPRTDLITLFDLKSTSCRWPYGDGPFLFCGLTVCNGDTSNSYCLYHTCVASMKPTQRVNTRPFHRAA